MTFQADGQWVDEKPEPRWLLRKRMFRRFELTIPECRPVRVTVKTLLETYTVEGLPAVARAEVIYVRVSPYQLVPIPKAYVQSIEPLFPRHSQDR